MQNASATYSKPKLCKVTRVTDDKRRKNLFNQRRLLWEDEDSLPPSEATPPTSAEIRAYSVAGITLYIRDLLERDVGLRDVWVTGEISNAKQNAASGHWYFTLKDSEARIACVMWKSAAQRSFARPTDGALVRLRGKISVYAPQGNYQIVVEEIQAAGGIGDLYAQFERLKQILADEGLFDEQRKRPLPAFPTCIGIVTSQDAAALRDVLNVLGRRYPLAQVILSPTSVQGYEAPAQIVRALERLNEQHACELIIVCRGGGSIEDLWAFNDERVARAISASAIPIISGVGHETDFTIADFVADLRAPTPSAAAELATPDINELNALLLGYGAALERAFYSQVQNLSTELRNASALLERFSPRRPLQTERQRLDGASERLSYRYQQALLFRRERLSARSAALEAANPHAILARGYAIVSRASDGTLVTRAEQVSLGESLHLRFADGTRTATLTATQDESP